MRLLALSVIVMAACGHVYWIPERTYDAIAPLGPDQRRATAVVAQRDEDSTPRAVRSDALRLDEEERLLRNQPGTPRRDLRPGYRRLWIANPLASAGAALVAIDLVLVGVGAGLLAEGMAAQQRPHPGLLDQTGLGEELAAFTFLTIGGASVVSGLVMWIVGSRRHPYELEPSRGNASIPQP